MLNRRGLIVLPVILIVFLVVVGVWAFLYIGETPEFVEKAVQNTVQRITRQGYLDGERDARFGFLTSSGGAFSSPAEKVARLGAGWMRPHPGPFVWQNMQTDEDEAILFQDTDDTVLDAQKSRVSVVATIWPYATWDQKDRQDVNSCIVNDEFSDVLGIYRCNPNNWELYAAWLTQLVERYDGDGIDDMPDLDNPIKYWEINNEPDLSPPPGEADKLQFFVGGPRAYAELLQKSYEAIKTADPEAKVIIAGASGGNDRALQFYRDMFGQTDAESYFDIANVHCVSNDNYDSFNVEPYKTMLNEFGITKPIWVTEAETFITTDSNSNASQLLASTQKAFEWGAETIIYTDMQFNQAPGGSQPGSEQLVEVIIDPLIDASDATATYQYIFSKFEQK